MSASNFFKLLLVLLVFEAGLLLYVGDWSGAQVFAQSVSSSPQPAPAEAKGKYADPDTPWRHAVRVSANRKIGPGKRGQEIYYLRCWMCHSEYAMATDPMPAPSLRDVFKRRDAQDVERMIRTGSARMPRYTRETLTDEEVKDLVMYLEQKCGTFPTGGGCFDEHNPPPNPLYRFPRDIAPTSLAPKPGGR